VPHYFGLEVLT